ncbi:MAG: efflux transporter outer membrane subunit, partial [Betaproteobacteria bacterium]|nr:efflux transporter outer membrane subunit [Betaproteobacteria bacterium]
MNKSAPLVLSISLALAGCTVGPNYQRPQLELPANIETAPVAASTAPTAGQAWWRVYQDAKLDSLIDEALAHNTDVQIAASRVIEAEAQLGLSRSDQQPTAYLSAERRRSRISESLSTFQSDIPSASTGNRVALNVSYEIDFWGRYRRATEAARADLGAVEANRATLGLVLANRVAQGYINLIALDAEWAATTQGVARAKDAYALHQKRLAAGVISTFEFGQREAEYQAAQALLPPIEKARAQQERALLTLLGRSPKAVLGDKIVRSDIPVTPSALPGDIPSELLLNRPDVREAEQKLIATNARIGVARAA